VKPRIALAHGVSTVLGMKPRFLAALGSAIVLLAGCGAKADCPPRSSHAGASPPGSADATASPSPSARTKKPTYSFGLPTGDNSTESGQADSRIYVTLDNGECTKAQTELDELAPDFGSFKMPQEIILYQAAIDLCLNHTQDAKNTYALVTGNKVDYPAGWLGIGWHDSDLSWHICELYKAVTGVFEQKSGDSISCKYRGFGSELSDYEEAWARKSIPRDDPR